MYLRAEKFVNGYSYQSESLDFKTYQVLTELMDAKGIADPDSPSATVSFTCAYWRKANQIHAWFVHNVQNDEDDCGEYDVERGSLVELLTICSDLLAAREDSGETSWRELCMAQLPPTPGFFFGSTDIDDGYVQDLTDTVEQLNRVLAATAAEDGSYSGWSFKYHSSW